MLTFPLLVGWIWSIWHGSAIRKNSQSNDDDNDDWKIDSGLSQVMMNDLVTDLTEVEEFPSYTNIKGIKFDIQRDFKPEMI